MICYVTYLEGVAHLLGNFKGALLNAHVLSLCSTARIEWGSFSEATAARRGTGAFKWSADAGNTRVAGGASSRQAHACHIGTCEQGSKPRQA